MGGIVKIHLDAMVEELNDMRSSKLYSIEETGMILKKRTIFENLIDVQPKVLESYKAYIEYETNLLKDLCLRRKKRKIGAKKNINVSITKRIVFLYKMALAATDDVSLYSAFFTFCKKARCVNSALEAVANLHRLHPDNPEVWKVVANWHAYDFKDVPTAIMTLQKAISVHKQSQMLYKELITIEIFSGDHNLVKVDTIVNRMKETLEIIFENVKEVAFYIELLELLEKNTFTIEVQDVLINKLVNEHSNNENVWHALAQRERRGLYFDTGIGSDTASTSRPTSKAKLAACLAKYREGLLKISANNKKKLWHLYLDFLINLHHDKLSCATSTKLSTLHSTFEDAAADNSLLEKHFIVWMEVKSDDALEILEKGVTAYPNSVHLWKLRLRRQILKGEVSKINKVFFTGVRTLQEKALPLWEAVIRYHCLASNYDYVKLIYQDGIKQPQEISNVLKPKYLKWLLFEGISHVRQVYNELAKLQPYCKDLHTTMSFLESIQIDYDFGAWGRVHELACQQFGDQDIDVWIDHIYFYAFHYKQCDNRLERIQSICKEAEKSLTVALVAEFFLRWTKIKETFELDIPV